ncbi:MAG: hypothetical protein EOP51_12305 [Sphingobacteriales bacterium]|nr:MAG: hypothetical protein EOP51_12305 [Sphingobacteriales bacterium]
MKIIAHRGNWFAADEKNTEAAFVRSIENGYGIETDIRDYNGELVVAHDVPGITEHPMLFKRLLQRYDQQKDKNAILAINIKSDGLQDLLADALSKYPRLNYFVFDMSLPMLYFGYRNSGLSFFSTVNEFMKEPICYEECAGIWLDGYTSTWFDSSIINKYLSDGKKVCIASPELHGRDHLPLWNRLMSSSLFRNNNLYLCTDIPEKAQAFFSR